MALRPAPTSRANILGGKQKFAYRALEQSTARRQLPYAVVSADKEFNKGTRQLAWNSALDLEQNLTLAGFMVRTHLNFVSSFSFQARTPDTAFNSALEKWLQDRARKHTVDVCRRMSLSTLIRTFAGLKVWFGDAALLKVKDGKLQLLEAWQIAKADDAPAGVNDNGLVLDENGAADRYAIAVKDDNGTVTHKRLVRWQDVEFDGYFTRANQTRGVSPLMPAINHARDYADAVNFHLIKSKIAAMFGMVIMRDHTKNGRHDFNTADVNDTDELAAKAPLRYELKPGIKLEIEKDEKAEFLESKTPPAEFIAFGKMLCRLIMAAIDMPYSVFDSDGATYSSMRADWNRYRLSAIEEREKNRATLDNCTEHIIRAGIADGSLVPPAGMTFAEIDWEWVPLGTFILDLSKELDAIIKKIGAGLQTRADACKELGTGDFADIADRLGKEEALLREKGVTVELGQPGATVSTDPQGSAP